MEPLALLGIMLPYILACALIGIVLSFFKSPWFKGFTGEMMVHLSIRTRLDKKNYHVLKNVIAQMILSTIESARLTPSRKTTRAHLNHVKYTVESKNGHSCPNRVSAVVVRGVNSGSNRGNKRVARNQLPDGSGTEFFLLDDDVAESEEDTDGAFTDSWQERSYRHDDLNSTFADRPFQ